MTIHRTRLVLGQLIWATIALTTFCLGCDSQQDAAETLVFEVDRQAAGLAADAPLERLPEVVKVLDARLGEQGRALADDKGLIQVEVFNELGDADFLRLVKRLEASGSLEFRILASATFPDDLRIIEQAAALTPDECSLSNEDGVIARWIPITPDKPQLVASFQADWTPDPDDGETDGGASKFVNPLGFAVRTIDAASDNPRYEILVLQDPYDVTGKYLERVGPGFLPGEYSVEFSFSDEGARRFGLLTRENEPTIDGRKRHLAILLNGSLSSAPTINSVITKHGTITGYGGADGEQERDDVLSVLQSGELPYPIKLQSAGKRK